MGSLRATHFQTTHTTPHTQSCFYSPLSHPLRFSSSASLRVLRGQSLFLFSASLRPSPILRDRPPLSGSRQQSTVPEHSSTSTFVSRGGQKLHHALTTFKVDVTGLTCADFGCSTGGFTDCLLQAGAAKVFSVDTAYGELAWKLRNDPRVVVMERTNCLHAQPPEQVDFLVADAGWTPQRLLIPAALRWLKPKGRMISLIKPHYELKDRRETLPPKGILSDAQAQRITDETLAALPALGVQVLGSTRSPLLGGAKAKGNAEWLALLAPDD